MPYPQQIIEFLHDPNKTVEQMAMVSGDTLFDYMKLMRQMFDEMSETENDLNAQNYGKLNKLIKAVEKVGLRLNLWPDESAAIENYADTVKIMRDCEEDTVKVNKQKVEEARQNSGIGPLGILQHELEHSVHEAELSLEAIQLIENILQRLAVELKAEQDRGHTP